METRCQRRKNKIKRRIRIVILITIALIIANMCYGIYKENNIRTEESNNVITENTLETNEINSIISVEIQQIEEKYMGYDVIAKLEVPKINLETYVLKDYTSDGMKVCASKFWGPEPNEVGNFCIAGHNYDQENMFNHLIDLEKGDELYLTDNKNGKYTYIVYDIYKVKPQNTTPIEQETNGKRIVTLITCVNYSKNRLIVQAIEK